MRVATPVVEIYYVVVYEEAKVKIVLNQGLPFELVDYEAETIPVYMVALCEHPRESLNTNQANRAAFPKPVPPSAYIHIRSHVVRH